LYGFEAGYEEGYLATIDLIMNITYLKVPGALTGSRDQFSSVRVRLSFTRKTHCRRHAVWGLDAHWDNWTQKCTDPTSRADRRPDVGEMNKLAGVDGVLIQTMEKSK
jgi:hypothetical protein